MTSTETSAVEEPEEKQCPHDFSYAPKPRCLLCDVDAETIMAAIDVPKLCEIIADLRAENERLKSERRAS